MEDTIVYILATLLLAFGTSGITYFWTRRKEKAHQKDEEEKQNSKLNYICNKFDLLEACQRDTATLQLISDTKYYVNQGWIPFHIKTLMLNVCDTLHKQGADGDVTQCEVALQELEGK